MKKVSKLLTAGLLTLSLVVFAGCGNGGNQEAEVPDTGADEKSVYIVGTNPEFAPFEYQDENGNIMGFDLDLMEAIAADQGFQIEVQSMEFDGLVMALQNGSIDIVASGMTITPERLEQVDFSDGYYNAGLNIAVLESNNTINGVEDLTDKVVSAQIGTTGALKCQELADQGLVKEAKLLADVNICMMDLQNGGCDAVINDIPVTSAYINANPGVVKVVGEEFDPEIYGLAVSKGNTPLLEKLNTGLANIVENGTYDALYAEHFGVDEETPADAAGAEEENGEAEDGSTAE